MKHIVFIICFLSVVGSAFSQRENRDFTFDWKFHFGHTYDIEKDFGYGDGRYLHFAKKEPAPYGGHGISATLLNFDESDWKNVQIPHDWSVSLPYDINQDEKIGSRYGFKPVGREYPETTIGWYRKKFDIQKDEEGRRFVIEFDGVFRDSEVWINGFYMGNNFSGYTGFSYDITDYLIYGKKNILSVRVNASLHEGWFYEGAGINKEVRLVVTDPLHIEDIGPRIVSTVNNDKAEIIITTKILNKGFDTKDCQIRHELMTFDNKAVSLNSSKEILINSYDEYEFTNQINVDKPILWSVDAPNRYILKTTLISAGKVIDEYITKIGIRDIKFDANNGFILNGERCQINGVCIHQNFGGVGCALNEALHIYRLKLLKEMGVNAIRSHYPFSKSMLNACDSLGVLVMDETRATGSYKDAISNLKWMINNHRNHPSVILYSMANEEGGTQRDIIGKRYMKRMVAVAHKYDSTRLVTAGVNAWNSPVDFGFSEAIDVMGFNYSLDFIDEYHKNHPNQPLIGTETANSTITRDFYEFSDDNKSIAVANGEGGYYTPENGSSVNKSRQSIAGNIANNNRYAYITMDFYATRKFLAGGFFWTGFDYNGEIWPSKGPNNSSQFGAMDLCGFPKDLYYYYKSWWSNEPVLHIVQHWNWNGMEGKEAEVSIHSNCDEIKLTLNGKKVGSQKMKTFGHQVWKVKYQPGTLKATGYKNGKKVATDKIITAGKFAQIKLTPDKVILKNNGKDIAVVRVELLDKKGNPVKLADNFMKFELEGDANILGTCNGNPSSLEIDSELQRKAYNGKAIVIIQSGLTKGEVRLKVTSGEIMNQISIKQ